VEQKTYIMIKPDAVARGLVGRIIGRFEDAGLRLERVELGTVTLEQAAANYVEHKGKPFYDGLVSYITSGPVVKMVLSGPGAVSVCRKLMGVTNPAEAAPGTIRGDYGLVLDANIVHGSDSPESAEREIDIFFS
jgi:nucleoside-diphosphate kinase